MSAAIQLIAYFEPIGRSDQAASAIGSDYVAGFRDLHGELWGLHVPVPASVVELAVLRRAAFTIGLEPDGRVLLRSDGLNEIALEAAAKNDCLPTTCISSLMTACLDPAELRREGHPVRDLERLRNDLIDALAMIDATLAKMRAERR
jgi:hypothetical protein